ncbi:MAG: DUF6036 family nucleotidyltransferase [Candidatus Woesearchaeota archaeon]
MINIEDQQTSFLLISNLLKKDIDALAIGGTAMMLLGYKTTTKDIDIVFTNNTDRQHFIDAICHLGYTQKSITHIYDKKRCTHKNKPLMFCRNDERFDLFVSDVFGYHIQQTSFLQRHDFIGTTEFRLYTPPIEELILLKAITRREKDIEDIHTILNIEKKIDWNTIIQKAIQQQKHNTWILIDLEEVMQELKTSTFIPQKHFKTIYSALP